MAKRPSGQGLLHNSGDPEATSPTRSETESFTGWPWSVRNDYKQLHMDNSSAASNSSHPSRMTSWGHQDDFDTGLPAGPSTQRLRQAVVIVIILKGLALGLDVLIAREDLRWFLKLLELCLSVVFMVMVLFMVHAEVTKLGREFCAKQAISEAERKEEMLRVVRADLISFREASLRQKAEADKEVTQRFANMDKEFALAIQKADGAAAYSMEQLTSMRQDLQSVKGTAESGQAVATAAAGCLEDLKSQLAMLKAASDACAEKLKEYGTAVGKPGLEEAVRTPASEQPAADFPEPLKTAGDGDHPGEEQATTAGDAGKDEQAKQEQADESAAPDTAAAAQQGAGADQAADGGQALADVGGPPP